MPDMVLQLHDKLAVVQLPEAKPVLVKLRQHKQLLRGIIQDSQTIDKQISLQPENILSIFPHKLPQFGKAYNTFVEPRLLVEKLPRWGNICFFRQLSTTELNNFHQGLDLAYRQFIRRNNLRFLLPINLEVRNPRGKMVGMWHKPKKQIEQYIEINPASFITNPHEPDNRRGGPKYIKRIVTHEISHPLYQLYLPDTIKARWVRLYHSFVRLQALTRQDLDAVRQDLIGSKITLRQYRKAAEEETKLFFDAILTWIKDTHHLDSRSLDLLMSQGDDLQEYWPRSRLHLSEIRIPITKYAGKNHEEFFCEAMSWFAIEEKLPRTIIKLIKRSIKAVQPK